MRHYIIVCLFLLFATSARGELIEVPVVGSRVGFGTSQVYQGQTFTAPSSPSFANTLTLFVGAVTISGGDFRVLLTEVDSSTTAIHPTKVLFESATFHVPLSWPGALDAIVVDLGGLRLDANREYAFILDHFVVANAADVFMRTGIGINYDGGFAFSFLTGGVLPGGTRQDHFASNNWIMTATDLAFTLDYSVIRVPGSWLLLLMNK